MVRIYGKDTKRRKEVQGPMLAARQASLMESWNIIGGHNRGWFCHPVESKQPVFPYPVPLHSCDLASLSFSFCFLLLLCCSCWWFYLDFWMPWHSLQNTLSCLRASSYHSVCHLLLFYSLLLPAVLSLYALHLNAQCNRIHYVSWFLSSIIWGWILLQRISWVWF